MTLHPPSRGPGYALASLVRKYSHSFLSCEVNIPVLDMKNPPAMSFGTFYEGTEDESVAVLIRECTRVKKFYKSIFLYCSSISVDSLTNEIYLSYRICSGFAIWRGGSGV